MFAVIAGGKHVPAGDVANKRRDLLEKLVALEELNDYWVRAFLVTSTKEDPAAVVALIKARLMEATCRGDWSYEPLTKEHNGKGLGLMDVEAGPRLLRELLDWALNESAESPSVWRIGEAVSGLCGSYDVPMLNLLLAWMSSGSQAHATLVARVLRESHPALIYEHPKFVKDILNEAELIGKSALDHIRSSISTAAHSGVRSGTPGEPFPEDVRLEQHCMQMLASLSRVEPAFDLYDGLLKDARYAIARQRRVKEARDDEDG